MEIHILRDIVAIFALSSVIILIFHQFRLPAIVAILLTGVIIGPHGLALVSAVHEVEIFAEVGVVLLLFTIGIEFSLKKLMRIKKAVFLGGSLQVGLTILVAALIVRLFGFPLNKAVFFGFLIALSSTAIVLKVFQERAEIGSPQGQSSLAILIFQDLVIVPMILFTPILAGSVGDITTSLSLLIVKFIGVILATMVLARWVVHGVLYQVARTKSSELFLMVTLLICLAITWATSSLGLSLALGAFIAGLIVSESEYSHHAFGQILPFRDLFTSFFFISIGMLLDLNVLLTQPLLVLAIVVGLLAIKAVIAGFVGTVIGLSFRTSLLLAFSLAQIGEFSFILSRFGLEEGLILSNTYQLFLAAAVLSMAATPFIIAASPRLARAVLKLPLPERIKAGTEVMEGAEKETLQDHLIIVGFGTNGRNVARAARKAEIPHLIIEMNPATVRKERAAGELIIFGDATREAALHHAGIERARVLVIAIPDAAATEKITELGRRLHPEVYLLVRTRHVHEINPLYQLGADVVIPEEFETSVEIFIRVLAKFDVPGEEIVRYADEIREDCYKLFRDDDTKENSSG